MRQTAEQMQHRIDPLAAFIAAASSARLAHPVPLVATSIDVRIEAGVAIVATKRTYRNVEATDIEATLTFPVPVHAALFDLEARVDGRVLKARAQQKAAARETYEDAIERGKAAVLHEELLRGIHMLSVANLRPGGEIEVVSTWATTLTCIEGEGRLRIPMTVGDVYGQSGLPDSDELGLGGAKQEVELAVRCADGAVALVGGALAEGRATVANNAPVDLVVTAWTPRDLRGQAATGRTVSLRVEPLPAADGPIDAAILVDHSGSMAGIVGPGGLTQHEAARRGIITISDRISDKDRIVLFEFDDDLTRVTLPSDPAADGGAATETAAGDRLRALAGRLSEPRGGTEIGGALSGVIAQSTVRDILLITDGQSHALDVHELARSGRWITVVLVGQGSLEARVGHLAALTGGEIFIASGADLTGVLTAALSALRRRAELPARVTDKLERLTAVRGGARLTAEWQGRGGASGGDDAIERAVFALAAALALPGLDEKGAAALAEEAGLVSHLTSLVLVDEAAAAQDRLPVTRKIGLPPPGVSVSRPARLCSFSDSSTGASPLARVKSAPPPMSRRTHAIDWSTQARRLALGDLSELDADLARRIIEAAKLPGVVTEAQRRHLDPVLLVIAILALAEKADRAAERVAKAICKGSLTADPEVVRLILVHVREPKRQLSLLQSLFKKEF